MINACHFVEIFFFFSFPRVYLLVKFFCLVHGRSHFFTYSEFECKARGVKDEEVLHC